MFNADTERDRARHAPRNMMMTSAASSTNIVETISKISQGTQGMTWMVWKLYTGPVRHRSHRRRLGRTST